MMIRYIFPKQNRFLFGAILLLSAFVIAVPFASAKTIDSSYILAHFAGQTDSSQIGVRVVGFGDVNGDGYTDVAVSSGYPRGALVYFGGSPGDGDYDMILKGYLPAEPVDLDGDGIDDLAVGDAMNYGTPQDTGVVYFYKGFGDSLGSLAFDSLIVPDITLGYGIHTGQVDADGFGDFVTTDRDAVGGPAFYYYSGCPAIDCVPDWTYRVKDYSHTGGANHLLTALFDVNGDHIHDIVIGLEGDQDTSGVVLVFFGPDFDTVPNMTINPPASLSIEAKKFGEGVFGIGDVDGDGYEDLGVAFGSRGLIYFGGPSFDTLHDYVTGHWAPFMASAGDINGDGHNDIITYSTSRSWDGSAELYLGGPGFDRYPDDYVLRSDLPPLFLDKVGWRVAGIGDFNGDGIDDFAVACQNFISQEPYHVFVFKGSANIVVPVIEHPQPDLPESLHLHQNYPNPFNPSTSIQFALPLAGQITLTIYNVLGEEVVTLIDKTLPAGEHHIVWDGTDNAGEACASGVYLYKLIAGDQTQSKKMVLVR